MALCDSVSQQWSDNVAFIRRLKVTDLKSRKKKVLSRTSRELSQRRKRRKKRREKKRQWDRRLIKMIDLSLGMTCKLISEIFLFLCVLSQMFFNTAGLLKLPDKRGRGDFSSVTGMPRGAGRLLSSTCCWHCPSSVLAHLRVGKPRTGLPFPVNHRVRFSPSLPAFPSLAAVSVVKAAVVSQTPWICLTPDRRLARLVSPSQVRGTIGPTQPLSFLNCTPAPAQVCSPVWRDLRLWPRSWGGNRKEAWGEPGLFSSWSLLASAQPHRFSAQSVHSIIRCFFRGRILVLVLTASTPANVLDSTILRTRLNVPWGNILEEWLRDTVACLCCQTGASSPRALLPPVELPSVPEPCLTPAVCERQWMQLALL